jgi:post-segregation antitoxin (ccd killing protein)
MALSKTLQYPTNIASGNNDYFMVGIFNYQPPGSGRRIGRDTDNRVLNITGSKGTRNLKRSLSNIILPMPDNISDSNAVTWDSDSLNSLQLAGINVAEDILTALKAENANKAEQLGKVVNKFFTGAGGAALDPTVRDAVKKSLIGEAINVVGGNIDAQSLISRTTGQVLNPNLELLFKGVILREFNYSFTLTPRDLNESNQIKQIISTLKQSMSAKKTASNGGGQGAFIQAPDVFQPVFMQGSRAHPFLYSIKQSALTGMNVNYIGTGSYATYGDGTPVKMQMQLRFRELSPVYNEDYRSVNDGVGF